MISHLFSFHERVVLLNVILPATSSKEKNKPEGGYTMNIKVKLVIAIVVMVILIGMISIRMVEKYELHKQVDTIEVN